MKSFAELVEEKSDGEKHHVTTFGRMNPPTTGHLKLIDKVKEIAHKHKAEHSVVTSHSQDAKKNPLSGSQKVKHLSRYSPGTNFQKSSKEHPTFLQHAAELHKKGVTHLHMVAGSDRVAEYKKKLNQYNGTHKGALYNFKKIHVHSAGHRDPDAEGATGMSGTKMRDAASEKRFHDVKDKTGKVVKPGFRSGVPSHVSDEHAKELMHHTRKGMGLHEDINHGLFKAIFVTGGPGSGKDIIIREAIALAKAVELNAIQAYDYLADKQKLSEKTSDFRREAIRNRGPLIINSPADIIDKISYIKEELESLGYETTMVFVDTTNQVSQERNTRLSRMMVESVRYEKWQNAQVNKQIFSESFDNFIHIDNTGSLECIEEDITNTYLNINEFVESRSYSDVALTWLQNHGKLNIGYRIDNLFKEDKNVKGYSKFSKVQTTGVRAAGPGDTVPDNRAGDSNADNIKWDANKRRGGYTFKTYTEESKPTLKAASNPKESNFSKDKESGKVKRFLSASRIGNPPGTGPEFDTRTSGQGLTGGAGLGDQTYSECSGTDYSNASPASNAMPSGGSVNPLSSDYTAKPKVKDFSKFRKQVKEAIDDPGASDMGVGGVLGGSTNKEGMDTYKDDNRNMTTIIKKKKKGAQ
jgi:hypothetical protein